MKNPFLLLFAAGNLAKACANWPVTVEKKGK
jgi:hypothetical protein